MRIASLSLRYLLGLMFTIFGLNGFLEFIHQPAPSTFLHFTSPWLRKRSLPLSLACVFWVLAFIPFRENFNSFFAAKRTVRP